ncbi:MAG TPA: amylo-alpha-1,6-glucosidase [Candidatus Binatia bacterium]
MSNCSSASLQRRLPIGAEVLGDGEVHFRVWASHSQRVEVIIGGGSCAQAVIELTAETSGYFSASSPLAKPGAGSCFSLQPEGPLGPSMIIDPARFLWHDTDWGGVKIEGQVIYEMHIGTFTAEGTWKAARQQLKALKDLGVTVLEIMPVHDFCGRFGWGYDGVDFFAPTRLYGSPDDFRAFIDAAHGLGLGIILDVVYNHAGPAGNYGAAPTEDESRWFIPGKAAFLLTAPKIMNPIVRKVTFSPDTADESEFDREPEWLVANGLGGYASGTVSGAATRRYHGLLIAALAAPFGRVLMLNGLAEEFHLPDGRVVEISPGQSQERNASYAAPLSEFRLDMGLPIWRYQIDDVVLEKRLCLPYRQNTVHITYRLLSHAGKLEIRLRPLIQFREHEGPVDSQAQAPYVLTVVEDQYEISSGIFPTLRLLLYGKGEFIIERKKIERLRYILEETRGYTAIGDLWTPGSFVVDCSPGQEITLAASTESWEVMRALSPAEAWEAERERRARLIASADPKAQTGVGAELVLAADQFVVTPAGRLPDATRAYATGDEMRTVIAGYHWFTDWGRDTMISLEGLTLTTNRFLEAGWILPNFANAIRQGLIPNLFPEGSREGLYHTADATLWFFHAIDRYLHATRDRWTLRLLLPKLVEIIDCHIKGTLFGIGIDSQDGLLHQGQEGYQLTWMDAKVDDWVVTPRRGKAVEINALWYNALRLLQQWLSEEDQPDKALELKVHADRARASFNERFWYGDEGYLFDVIDGENGNDAACRPNQLLAISLRHPVLDPGKWRPVLETVRQRLLTPVGLRSLSPGHPNYKARYFGDLRSRDAAYHQGTVWGWLIGPFIDAWLKVHPDDVAGARALLEGFVPHLGEAGVGSISEIFDADEPFVPRGCISQAWSVAEALRCWVKTAQ